MLRYDPAYKEIVLINLVSQEGRPRDRQRREFWFALHELHPVSVQLWQLFLGFKIKKSETRL
jgi:hypothetical protein